MWRNLAKWPLIMQPSSVAVAQELTKILYSNRKITEAIVINFINLQTQFLKSLYLERKASKNAFSIEVIMYHQQTHAAFKISSVKQLNAIMGYMWEFNALLIDVYIYFDHAQTIPSRNVMERMDQDMEIQSLKDTSTGYSTEQVWYRIHYFTNLRKCFDFTKSDVYASYTIKDGNILRVIKTSKNQSVDTFYDAPKLINKIEIEFDKKHEIFKYMQKHDISTIIPRISSRNNRLQSGQEIYSFGRPAGPAVELIPPKVNELTRNFLYGRRKTSNVSSSSSNKTKPPPLPSRPLPPKNQRPNKQSRAARSKIPTKTYTQL